MMLNDCTIKIAQSTGILGSAFISGVTFSLSRFTIPSLIIPTRTPHSLPSNIHPAPGSPTSHITHQWVNLHRQSNRFIVILGMISSAAYGYLSWLSWGSCRCKTWLYLAALVVNMGIVPFTQTVMQATGLKLEEYLRRDDKAIAEGKEGMVTSVQEEAKRDKEDREVLGLVKRWSCLNLIRGIFPLAGALIGVYAVAFV